MADKKNQWNRREILAAGARGAGLLAVGGMLGYVGRLSAGENQVWQLDPLKCTACGNCATYCVLEPSAVKCVHSFDMCGYCKQCFGYIEPKIAGGEPNPQAEGQLCPTNAIIRKYVREPYFEYTIDEDLCVGCGKCVLGCAASGNGSLHLQVRHDLCLNCNECAIAEACPAEAFERVDARTPYMMKSKKDKDAGH